ncbi:MAG TPA: 50S ribosomal protein L25 [Phototrophicaceae bacterium]|nr:50S ribosomal protein L25 [Phototrophicaceae bacterium]
MAETYSLDAQSRTLSGKKVHQLRVQGLVPAVIYGARVEPVNVQIPYRALEVTLMKAGGTRLINVNFDGKTQSVITRAVQRDILRGTILHVDFLAVDASTRIRADVQIHLVGESPAVQTRVGNLLHQTSTLSIEAVPADLIDAVEVDISGLKEIGDAIHVRDLNINPNITVLNDPDELVVRVNAIREITEEVTEGEGAAAEPEVISKGKAEEEEEE